MRLRFPVLESSSDPSFGSGKPMAMVLVGALCAALCSVTQVSGADDVDAILRQIKSESTQGPAPQPAPPAATVKKTERQQSSKAKTRQSKPQQQPSIETFSGPIWGPKDKLPKQIRGHGLAGRFVVAGQFEGQLLLEAEEDNMNPFCRRFVVANKTLNLPDPYYTVPFDQREVLTIPRSNPLVFLKKTSFAYYYVHMH
ncbi:MAG: hypothetical protein JHC85_09870 [Chthoniobacterales bacterium]|nr:hypothetical protein [Chthoniobacterales bacterium]